MPFVFTLHFEKNGGGEHILAFAVVAVNGIPAGGCDEKQRRKDDACFPEEC